MGRTSRILPVCTADTSGICLALYGLGGMIMMYGASGYNSTYTAHNEPRWCPTDSMMYVSTLSELEAVVGDDEKLVRDIVDIALSLCPALICIEGTPIPATMGTDSRGIVRMIENKTGTPTFGIATNGMHSYVRRAGETLKWIVKRFCPPGVKAGRPAALKVNILGVTPLDLSLAENIARLKDFLKGHGMEIVECWTIESGLDEPRLVGLVSINLVVSAVGLSTAAELKKMYRTPWAAGTPAGRRISGRLAERTRWATRTGENQSLFDGAGYVALWDADACIRPDLGFAGLSEDLSGKKVPTIGGQATAGSLRCCLWEEWSADRVTVLCPIGGEKALALEGDIIDWDEDKVTRAIAESMVAVADPLYRQVCLAYRNIVFVDFPHEACSGRMYYSTMRPFICAPDDSV